MSIGQYNWAPNNYWSGLNTWPYYQQYNNQNFNNIQQPVNNLLKVTGPESAKAYPLPPKSTVVLFDEEEPVFYVKTTDDSGFANPPRAFKFEEITETQLQPINNLTNTSEFATKNDLELLQKNISEIRELLEGLVN